MRRFSIYAILFFVNSIFFVSSAQSSAEKSELQSLQEEIRRYEQQLKQKSEKQKAAAELIAGLDRQIDLTSSNLYRQRKELESVKRQIEMHQKEIAELEAEIAALKEIIKKRLVAFYKYGRRPEYELLLSAKGIQHVDAWLRYQKIVAENDRRNFKALASRKERLEQELIALQQQQSKKEVLTRQYELTAAELKNTRAKRSEHLKSLQKDADFLRARLNELQAAQRQIEKTIADLETRRREQQKTETASAASKPQPSAPRTARRSAAPSRYDALEGRLPWPTEGTVVTRFGKQRHPVFNTITENLGIDIRASLGAPVRAVLDGKVETISWQRGSGSIIILSHGDGYYTVYTHVAEIRVNVGDTIKAGDLLGVVGDSGSLSGPLLHFQIWRNSENLDPEKWLSKKRLPAAAGLASER